ncbi:MAG: type II secretion system protein [Verrucomicrobiales bacterium]|nr:type II secretion system protein [Verrucomicrobiales bacterium]
MSSPTPSTGPRARRGFTLVEVTLVIAVLLMMISILFLGVSAYKKGSDRAFCIQTIATVQKAVRSYANLNALGSGESVTNLKDQIIGPDLFVVAEPACPSGGTYTYGGNTIPLSGVAYLSCSIAEHTPPGTASW